MQNPIENRIGRRLICMKAEKYLLEYMIRSNTNLCDVQDELGIDVKKLENNEELFADEFVRLCVYLGINPDDVMNEMFSR